MLLLLCLGGLRALDGRADEAAVTFNKDVAPIVFKHCVECHRPDAVAPFGLLTYDDVRKRARQIVEVTADRLMPPWPPETGYGDFVGHRGLSGAELAVLKRWVEDGAVEGDPPAPVPPPAVPGGWTLGEPDLVVTVGGDYRLAADGPDVYRSFVAAILITERRYVRAVEFIPENPAVVHHAFIKIDETDRSRRMDKLDPTPGFEEMNVTAEMPPGNFLTWKPGTQPAFQADGLNWPLEPGTDLVVRMHLRPVGKSESARAKVGFHFSDEPPSLIAERVLLASLALDIPAGETNYVVEDVFTLPVDVRIMAVLPHAHYLAREMQGYAELPDGRREWLLWIRNWDFNWQGHYRYREPVELPKGTRLHMRYRYDNSASNPQNPTHPPVRVFYGDASTDEMAELWFQMVVESEADRAILQRAFEAKKFRMFVEEAELAVRRNPYDAAARLQLGKLLLGLPDRQPEAVRELEQAARLNPGMADSHYYLGLWNRSVGRVKRAEQEFRHVVEMDSQHARALGNLGVILAERGELDAAEEILRQATRADPDDPVAQEVLAAVLQARQERAARR